MDLDHTALRDLPPPRSRPVRFWGQAGTGQVTLNWSDPYPGDPSISGWRYRVKSGSADWGSWTDVANSTAATRSHTVSSLAQGKFHKFEVRAVNAAGAGRASETLKVALMQASYSASSYEAVEGGAAVEVTVRLSPGVDRPVSIPVTLTDVDAESGDYTVSGLVAGSLSFRAGDHSKRFTVTAVADDDTDAETVTLGLGALPAGVTAGAPSTATLRLRESSSTPPGAIPPQPASGLSARSDTPGEILVSWGSVTAAPTVRGYTLRFQTGFPLGYDKQGTRIWTWPATWNICPLPARGATDTSFTQQGLNVLSRYRYQVQATNERGDSDWSAAFPANGVVPAPSRPALNDLLLIQGKESAADLVPSKTTSQLYTMAA